ncbi:centrosomal protein of 135 kDa-like isoform X1 [Armigeres subalbatus]|uniref:centrosomal protein of 135 kDa-like isoform X1 n=1 Tax=Armigeres subalbatus TaxID=124917 RepID=UPI002ED27B07
MDIDTLHLDLRKRLNVLGFNHPLPLGAIGIVSAILDDLIKTSEKLKSSKQQICHLEQEKAAWDLGVEPYKCDNSRLLAECNELHLELVKQRDKFILANTELKCRVRNLQTDKKQLEDRCLQAEAKIRQLQCGDSKSRKDGANMQRKPFVSTVRPGQYQPPTCCGGEKREGKCGGACSPARKTEILHEIEHLQIETKNQEEVIEAYKKQIDCRDREIQRLGALFAGGRPAAALAKDCCYRNVNTLTEDVKGLQEEKTSIQNKLTEALENQQSAGKKIHKLSERNKQLEQELKEIENVALNVESEANLNILNKDRENSDLQIRLQRSNMRIKELETLLAARTSGSTPVSSSASACSLDSTLQNALKQANEEKRALYKQLNELKQREQTFLTDYEKIKSKYSKLKLKISNQIAFVGADSHQNDVEIDELKEKCLSLENSLKHAESNRDLLSKEIMQLRENIIKLNSESVYKTDRIAQLESEQKTIFNQAGVAPRLRTADSAFSGQTSLSVQSAFHRVERERDAARREVQQLEAERDSLRTKLKLATKSQKDEKAKHEETIISYSSKIAKLEAEKRDVLCAQSSSQTTLQMLKDDNRDLQERLQNVESSFKKMKISHSQLKILHEQTERALLQHQNRLICSENQLDSAEAKLTKVDGTIEHAQKDIGKLRGDISVLKASNASLQQEKDKLLMELDKKTEKLYTVEAELSTLKTNKIEMRDTIDRLERKLENANVDNLQIDSNLRSVATETDTLRKQVATLKRSHDNAVTENGRLSNDLSDTASELTLTKRKLSECQKEVERMKSQLREYVQEIQRAEELLCIKERERGEMLEHYKSLSEGVNMLEVSNHTLEAESAEAKKLLQEAEGRINGLQERVGLREAEIKSYEEQINRLSSNVVSLESDVECLKEENQNLREDLEATKELCNKLDLQKDKLNAELEEHSNIREQLNKENSTLKRQLSLAHTGDKAAMDGLQELLAASRAEVEQQRIVTNQLNQEAKTLKDQIEELKLKLDEEERNAVRSDALANEYSVQLQELRRMITDDRFAQVQSREEEDYNRIKPYLKSEESIQTDGSNLNNTSSILESLCSESSEIPDHSQFMRRLCTALRKTSPPSFDSSGSSSSNILESTKKFSDLDRKNILNTYNIARKISSQSKENPNQSHELIFKNEDIAADSNGLYKHAYDLDKVNANKVAPHNGDSVTIASESLKEINTEIVELLSSKSDEGKLNPNSTKRISPVKEIGLESGQVRDQSMQIDSTEGNEEVPAGWKVSRYRSMSKSSSSIDDKNATRLNFNKTANTSKRKKSRNMDSFENSSYMVNDFKSLENRPSQASTPFKVPSSSIAPEISTDIAIRNDNVTNTADVDALPDIVQSDRNGQFDLSSLNSPTENKSAVYSELPSVKILQTDQTDHQETKYEKFKKDFLQKRSQVASVPKISIDDELSLEGLPQISNYNDTMNGDKSKAKRASNEQDATEKIAKPEQSTTANDKTDELSSTVVIYKTAAGERLILADDQRRNGADYGTARDTSGNVMVIDDLRRVKTPIRTPTVPNRKTSSESFAKMAKNGSGKLARNDGSPRINSIKKRCEERKWREILQNHPNPSSKQQHEKKSSNSPSSRTGTMTNERVTTINYEIHDTRRRRRSGEVSNPLETNNSGRMSLPQISTTSDESKVNPKIECNYEPKAHKLNFKITVPGKAPMKNTSKK